MIPKRGGGRISQVRRKRRCARATISAGDYVGEPFDDTVAILRGLKEKYEVHHGVNIADDAIGGRSVIDSLLA